MNSLVVLLSVVALAAAKPSGLLDHGYLSYSAPLGYSTPLLATGSAAVSSQSRLDIKTSPAIVSTAAVAPVARTVFGAPAAIATPVAYAAPAAIAAPVAYAAPSAIAAPAAVSHQSRVDIKSSPAVITTSVSAPVARTVIAQPALYSASAAVAAPALYSAPAAIAAPTVYSSPASAYSEQSRIDIKSTPAITSTVVASAPVAYSAYNSYSAPIISGSFAPTYLKTAAISPLTAATTFVNSADCATGILGAPAVPLDTPEVVAARTAHLEAKALADAHLIRKRSVLATASVLSSPFVSTYAAPVVSTYAAAPIAYSSPLAVSAPLITKTYSVHPW